MENSTNESFQNVATYFSEIEEDQCVPNGIKCIECLICGLYLNKIYTLRKHMYNHVNEDTIDLGNIEKTEIYTVLNPHLRKIDKKIIRNFIIKEIKAKRYSQFYGILNEAGVELHISDSETESESDNTSDIRRYNYKCELCKLTFDRRYKILFHQKTAHVKDDLFIECDYCTKSFVCMNLLIHHLKTQCENDEKPISCVNRFKKFLLEANLEQFSNLAQEREQRKNRKHNTAPKMYECNICHKTFIRSEHLTRHKAVHLPEELKFECSVCNRRFNRKDNMRSHMKIHSEESERDLDERTILCSYCGHSFASKSNYVVHMRRHTGEKPYKCEVCGKGFPKSTDLNSHKITHTGEKNFICPLCNKAFARSAVLSKHMRIHSGIYKCSYCDKSFIKPVDLNLHVRSHNADKLNASITTNINFKAEPEPKTLSLVDNKKNVDVMKLPTDFVRLSTLPSMLDPLEIKEDELRKTNRKPDGIQNEAKLKSYKNSITVNKHISMT